MKGRFLLSSHEAIPEGNIYANRSATVLAWLLQVGIDKKRFSLREIANDCEVSIGLVQRVLRILILHGLIGTDGIRTGKSFFLKNPVGLLKNWLDWYSIIKKCKMWTYQSGFQKKEEMLEALVKSGLNQKVALALHSAAETYGCKNTNLQTLELYILEPVIKAELEKVIRLEPQERGYEVLLIAPYYKCLFNAGRDYYENIKVSSVLLTFLDLYHFPMRGHEQAEFMAQRLAMLKHIIRNGLRRFKLI